MTKPKYGISRWERPVGYRWASEAPPATQTPTTADLYWAAGFLEGEGTFGRTNRNRMRVSADQVNKEPLERLLALFGGTIHTRAKRHENWNVCHTWYVLSDRARGVMFTLYELLSLRRREQIIDAMLLSRVEDPAQRIRGFKPVQTLELHWAAGFLEAEGSFTATVEPRNYLTTHTVHAAQVNREPLTWLYRMFGGTVIKRPPAGKRSKSDCFHWKASGPRARGVMQTLFPLLSARRQGQVIQALKADHRQCLPRCA